MGDSLRLPASGPEGTTGLPWGPGLARCPAPGAVLRRPSVWLLTHPKEGCFRPADRTTSESCPEWPAREALLQTPEGRAAVRQAELLCDQALDGADDPGGDRRLQVYWTNFDLGQIRRANL